MRTRKQKTEALIKPSTDQEPGASSIPVINHWLLLPDEMILYILRLLPAKDLANVPLINKKFRDLSSLWTELTLAYEDIQTSEDSCRKLIERCKKLARLRITSATSNSKKSVYTMMSPVIRAKKSLRTLTIDSSIRVWTDDAAERLGQLKNLRSITMTINLGYYKRGMGQLAKLDQLEELCVRIGKKEERFTNACPGDLKNELQQFKKLKKVDIGFADENLVATLTSNNPDLEALRFQYWKEKATSFYLNHVTLYECRFFNNLPLHKLRSEYPGIVIERSTAYD